MWFQAAPADKTGSDSEADLVLQHLTVKSWCLSPVLGLLFSVLGSERMQNELRTNLDPDTYAVVKSICSIYPIVATRRSLATIFEPERDNQPNVAHNSGPKRKRPRINSPGSRPRAH